MKFFSKPASDKTELIAEVLESRTLYSAAPIDLPTDTVVTEVITETVSTMGTFEGLDQLTADTTVKSGVQVARSVKVALPEVTNTADILTEGVDNEPSSEPNLIGLEGPELGYSEASFVLLDAGSLVLPVTEFA